jgi:hypothetical protein
MNEDLRIFYGLVRRTRTQVLDWLETLPPHLTTEEREDFAFRSLTAAPLLRSATALRLALLVIRARRLADYSSTASLVRASSTSGGASALRRVAASSSSAIRPAMSSAAPTPRAIRKP